VARGRAARRGSHLLLPSNCSSPVPLQILAAPMNTGQWQGQRQPVASSRPDPVFYAAALLLAAQRTRIPCSTLPAPTTGDLPLASAQQRPRPPPAPCSSPDPVAILAPPQALPGHNCSSERAGGVDLAWSCGGFGRAGGAECGIPPGIALALGNGTPPSPSGVATRRPSGVGWQRRGCFCVVAVLA
jgi:hypothetical protein